MWLTPTNLENKAAFKENVKMHILSKRWAASKKRMHFLFRLLPSPLLTMMSLARSIWKQKHI